MRADALPAAAALVALVVLAGPAAGQQTGGSPDTIRIAQDTVRQDADTTAGAPAVPDPATAQNPTLPPPLPMAERPPLDPGELRLVFEREVFRYPGGNRRDPFRPLTGQNEAGPLFEDLALRMIIYSEVPGESIVVLVDGARRVYRLRRGQSTGNVTVTDIGPSRVVFAVEDFGVRRQEILSIKDDNTSEGA
jgi:hypothetical protein